MAISKDQRQATILELARDKPIRTQAEFLDVLRARRVTVDQSTLSRDLAELNIRKTNGHYVVIEEPKGPPQKLDYSAVVFSFTTCGPHLIVIRTGVGQGSPVAVAIEEASEFAITATLAGDDTIFVATKNRRAQVVALRRLKQWFGDKHEP